MARITVGGGEEVGVIPTGAINGSNRVFVTPSRFRLGTLRLHYNGVRYHTPDDFAVSEGGGVGAGYDTLTLAVGLAPRPGDTIVVDYTRG